MRGRYVGCDGGTVHSPSGWSSDERMMNNVQQQLLNLPHHSRSDWTEGSWATQLLTVQVFFSQFCDNNQDHVREEAFLHTAEWYGLHYKKPLTRPKMKRYIKNTCFPLTPISLIPLRALPPTKCLMTQRAMRASLAEQEHIELSLQEQERLQRDLWQHDAT